MPWMDRISRCKRGSDHERIMHICSCTSVHVLEYLLLQLFAQPSFREKKKNLVPSKEEERGIQEGLLKGFRSSPGVR